jgi:predicted GNAT family acetyltransferase
MKAKAIIDAVEGVTKKWAKQRMREDRERSAASNRHYIMTRSRHVSLKAAAWQHMEEAYLKASANGKLPAQARQVMYAARPHIQRTADPSLGKGFDQYFTQTLLPDYIEEKGVAWNVVYDARGHFTEPHTDKEVPLGTLQRNTRRYQYNTSMKVIDLGLRLEDIDGLESEEVYIDRGAAANLRKNGATEEEIAYLLSGRRVELNALASDELVAFIERKLKKHGIAKVIPDTDTLEAAYRRMRRQAVCRTPSTRR